MTKEEVDKAWKKIELNSVFPRSGEFRKGEMILFAANRPATAVTQTAQEILRKILNENKC